MKSHLLGVLLIFFPLSSAWSDTKSLIVTNGGAKSYAVSKKFSTPNNSVVVTDGKAGARICYYEDRAYSIGAVIQVGDVYLICQSQNDHELNGQLGWVPFNAENL